MKKKVKIAISLLLFLLNFSAHANPARPHYALIIDAGSTGSRLHLFEYQQAGSLPQINDLFSESVKPGLSSYENNTQAAGASLKKMLDDALAELQKRQVDPATVSIKVLGTGGLRLLPADKQAAIYNNVALYIKNNYPLIFEDAKTIPGALEGLFGWLDVNYLLKNFAGPEDQTKGSIDLGGASTQITFSTTDARQSAGAFKLHLGGRDYLVYSKSFLGLGLVEALKQVNRQSLAAACYPQHYRLHETDSGQFNFTSCGALYATILEQAQVRQQLTPLAKREFVAYSGAYYTANFFGAAQAQSRDSFTQKVQAVCGKTWEELRAAYPGEPEQYLSMYCANGVYLNQLLYEAYQLAEKQLDITARIQQQEIDWTLGALLYQLVTKEES